MPDYRINVAPCYRARERVRNADLPDVVDRALYQGEDRRERFSPLHPERLVNRHREVNDRHEVVRCDRRARVIQRLLPGRYHYDLPSERLYYLPRLVQRLRVALNAEVRAGEVGERMLHRGQAL